MYDRLEFSDYTMTNVYINVHFLHYFLTTSPPEMLGIGSPDTTLFYWLKSIKNNKIL